MPPAAPDPSGSGAMGGLSAAGAEVAVGEPLQPMGEEEWEGVKSFGMRSARQDSNSANATILRSLLGSSGSPARLGSSGSPARLGSLPCPDPHAARIRTLPGSSRCPDPHAARIPLAAECSRAQTALCRWCRNGPHPSASRLADSLPVWGRGRWGRPRQHPSTRRQRPVQLRRPCGL